MLCSHGKKKAKNTTVYSGKGGAMTIQTNGKVLCGHCGTNTDLFHIDDINYFMCRGCIDKEESQAPFLEEAVKNGDTCPFCGYEGIESEDGSQNFDGNHCSLKVYCLDCDESWVENYKLYRLDFGEE